METWLYPLRRARISPAVSIHASRRTGHESGNAFDREAVVCLRVENVLLGGILFVALDPIAREGAGVAIEGVKTGLRLICAAGALLPIVIEEGRGQQWNHDLVMANEGIPFS